MSHRTVSSLSRRQFLQTTALAGAGAALTGCMTFRRPGGGLSDVRVACVGIGGKGSGAIQDILKLKGKATLAALCDVDRDILAKRAAEVEKKTGVRVPTFVDYRELLESKDIDAVVISSPNHWHTLQTIWACEAGKEVYVEKPVAHTLFECRQIAAAAKKHGRIVQAGTQSRSDVGLIPAFAELRAGALGKIKRVTIIVYRYRESIGRVGTPIAPPASVDYDLWCGPGPKEPLRRKKLHYDWHYFWDWGDGEIGNQAPHELDMACWVLGEPRPPRRVLTMGGRFLFDDDGETPNVALTIYDFDGVEVVLDTRCLPMKTGMDESPHYMNLRTGLVVDCENGRFVGGRGGGKFFSLKGEIVKKFSGDGGGGHMLNFVEAIRAGSPRDLRAPIAQSANSVTLAHLGNVAYRSGTPAPVAALREACEANSLSREHFGRLLEHLKLNGLDPDKTPLACGGWLDWDPATQHFSGPNAAKANALVTRTYREPFVVRAQG